MRTGQETGGKKVFSVTKKALLICLGVLLALNIVLMGVSLARYTEATTADTGNGVAAFGPEIEHDEKWEMTGSVSGAGWEDGSRYRPFYVSNTESNTSSLAIVTLTVGGVLPLEYSLYACAESELADSTALTPTTVEGNTYTYEIAIDAGASQAFTLAVDWQDGAYDERFNGLTETMYFCVVCEQA